MNKKKHSTIYLIIFINSRKGLNILCRLMRNGLNCSL